MLLCDWLISSLCYQVIEQVYLVKWLVSVYHICYLKKQINLTISLTAVHKWPSGTRGVLTGRSCPSDTAHHRSGYGLSDWPSRSCDSCIQSKPSHNVNRGMWLLASSPPELSDGGAGSLQPVVISLWLMILLVSYTQITQTGSRPTPVHQAPSVPVHSAHQRVY